MYYLCLIALRHFDSKRLREQIIAHADYWVWKQGDLSSGWHATMACLAYELTKDKLYAAYCSRCVKEGFPKVFVPLRTYDRVNFGSISMGSSVPRLMRVVAKVMDEDPRALEEAEELWRQKRSALEPRQDPARPDTGPETSLGILSTDPLPKE